MILGEMQGEGKFLALAAIGLWGRWPCASSFQCDLFRSAPDGMLTWQPH
jgi:hypothetical protein